MVREGKITFAHKGRTMKRELLILRHGKSDWSKPVDDFHRPLKKRGRKSAVRMGAWMDGQGIVPEIILSSPAVRARETARLAAEGMHIAAEVIENPAIYEGGLDELLQIVRSLPKYVGRVLLVGHNTGIEEFVFYLAGGRVAIPANGKLMPTAALARFVVSGAWKKFGPDRAELVEIVRPRQLAEKSI